MISFQMIPLIHTIKHVLENQNQNVSGSGLKGLQNDLVASLKRRYPNVESETVAACATLLDPRFKSTPFKNKTGLEIAKRKLISEMKSNSYDFSQPTESFTEGMPDKLKILIH